MHILKRNTAWLERCVDFVDIRGTVVLVKNEPIVWIVFKNDLLCENRASADKVERDGVEYDGLQCRASGILHKQLRPAQE
jgi:hypothetical protein